MVILAKINKVICDFLAALLMAGIYLAATTLSFAIAKFCMDYLQYG